MVIDKCPALRQLINEFKDSSWGHPEPYTNEEILQIIGILAILQTTLKFRLNNKWFEGGPNDDQVVS